MGTTGRTKAAADEPLAERDVHRTAPRDAAGETPSRETHMEQGNDRNVGSEDNSEAVEHVHNAQENRDALQDQARRVQASAPDTDQPVEGFQVEGMGGEDNAQANENLRHVQENTDALRDQARRVQASAPDDINRTGPQNG